MMFKKIWVVIFIPLLYISCASTNGFEDGRTNGKGVYEVKGMLGVTSTFIIDDFVTSGDIEAILLPNLAFGIDRGIKENFDLGGRIDIWGNIALNSKFQFYGTKESKIGLAIGFEVGSNLYANLTLPNIQIPFYSSYHFSHHLSIYASPRYIRQIDFSSVSDASLNYFGGNVGLMAGSKHKFGIDIAIFNVSALNENLFQLINFNFGGKFRF